jgi:diaminopimelate decarboxylase
VHVAVDGGETVTVVGRHCESGDRLVVRGDTWDDLLAGDVADT